MLKGIVPAMITPTRSGQVALDVLKTYTEWLINHGVDGLFPLGTTGEGLLLSRTDWEEAVRTVISAANGRTPVVLQCGGVSLQDSLRRIDYAIATGANGIALMAPYFYVYSGDELETYFATIFASRPSVKFYLYNIPKYTHNDITPALYRRLANRFENLLGIKDSSGSIESLAGFVDAVPGRAVLSGSDATLKEAHRVGACGIVSGVAAALPQISLDAWRHLQSGDASGAEYVVQIRNAFHKSSTIRAARAVLEAQGLAMGDSLPPLPKITETQRKQLYVDLQSIGISLGMDGEAQPLPQS